MDIDMFRTREGRQHLAYTLRYFISDARDYDGKGSVEHNEAIDTYNHFVECHRLLNRVEVYNERRFKFFFRREKKRIAIEFNRLKIKNPGSEYLNYIETLL